MTGQRSATQRTRTAASSPMQRRPRRPPPASSAAAGSRGRRDADTSGRPRPRRSSRTPRPAAWAWRWSKSFVFSHPEPGPGRTSRVLAATCRKPSPVSWRAPSASGRPPAPSKRSTRRARHRISGAPRSKRPTACPEVPASVLLATCAWPQWLGWRSPGCTSPRRPRGPRSMPSDHPRPPTPTQRAWRNPRCAACPCPSHQPCSGYRRRQTWPHAARPPGGPLQSARPSRRRAE
mmetsp:Transcript_56827/g.152851  ORF Transcript_56827/g.152851 Transcript_56827/m.152851 type:complete len:234 (+) Transcript_56827:146-847(+)